MAKSLAFYRRLGLDLPADRDVEPHVECTLPNGLRVAFDTIATMQSFDPHFDAAARGHGVSLAFLCDDPADVDATFASMVAAGAESHAERASTVRPEGSTTVPVMSCLVSCGSEVRPPDE